MFKPLMLVPPLVFVALAGLFYVGMQRENPDDLPSMFIGQPAPVMTEEPLPGLPPVMADKLAAGEFRLVNFWASWCPPCRAEHPVLLRLQEQGIQIAGINMKDDADDAQAFLDELGNPFAAVAFDPMGRSSIDWGVTAPPETFLVDQNGTVVFRLIGPMAGAVYEKRFLPELERVLNEE